MKKILSAMLIVIISINLIGCQENKVDEVIKYQFDYKFKEEYSEINNKIAITYLGIISGLKEVHLTVLEINNQESDNRLNEYIGEYLEPIREHVMIDPTSYTMEEGKVLMAMFDIATAVGKMQLVKMEYEMDMVNKLMGLKLDNTPEQYIEKLEGFKKEIEVLLDGANEFID